MVNNAEARLGATGIELPPAPPPFGPYVPAVQTGNLLFLTGMLPTVGHEAKFLGRAGNELNTEQGRSAARYPHSSRHVTHGPYDGRKTCRSLVALRLPDWISFYRRLCPWNGASGRQITIGSFV